MNWCDIEKPWQAAFEQGWEAFRNGSIPIGAVIVDETNEIISVGRNRIFEFSTPNSKIAHAEMECLLKLDIQKYPNVKEYTVYACMEPCPMCFGTIVMSNIRKVKIASRDRYCGAAHYSVDDPYVVSKNMNISFEMGKLETVQLVMQTYFELRVHNGEMTKPIQDFQKDNLDAIRIAEEYYRDRTLDIFSQNGRSMRAVYDSIVSLL